MDAKMSNFAHVIMCMHTEVFTFLVKILSITEQNFLKTTVLIILISYKQTTSRPGCPTRYKKVKSTMLSKDKQILYTINTVGAG